MGPPELIISGVALIVCRSETMRSGWETINSRWETVIFVEKTIDSKRGLMLCGRESIDSDAETVVIAPETMDLGRS